jgi:hypothetical protein
MHASVILAQDIREYAPLFSEIADAYYDQRMYTAAVAIYEELGQDPAVCHPLLPSKFTHRIHRSRRVVSMFWNEPRLVVG